MTAPLSSLARRAMRTARVALPLALLATLAATTPALAQDAAAPAPPAADPITTKVMIDTVWVLLAAVLVFFMNAGFGLLEAGFCRSKNTVSVLAKNFAIAACAGLAFYILGFGLMFADGNAIVGTQGFFLSGADNSPAINDAYQGVFSSLKWTGVPLEAKFFFQVCFAMTAASIVSGAVAERIKFHAFMTFSTFLVAIVYSTTGHWIWGGGWLASQGFWDFAGSTQVHSVGGWAALTGAFFLGARRGKYNPDGTTNTIPGHSLALATAGGFILWLGWFGFNAGSTMAADPASMAHICTTTMLASLAGVVGALLAQYVRTRKVDLSMMINGCLAGLVGITAPCAFVSSSSAVVIGLVAGLLVVPATVMFDRFKLDDPVGAISVHLVGGIWGTLAVGLFAQKTFSADVGDGLLFGGGAGLLGAQVLGVAAVGGFVLLVSSALWLTIRATLGLRVDAEHEDMGLDLSELGVSAYPIPGVSALVQTPEAATLSTPSTAATAAAAMVLLDPTGGSDPRA